MIYLVEKAFEKYEIHPAEIDKFSEVLGGVIDNVMTIKCMTRKHLVTMNRAILKRVNEIKKKDMLNLEL